MAIFELQEGRYFIGAWFLYGEDAPRDVLCAVFRDKGSSLWQMRYRIREYHPESGKDPFHDKDTKKSWRATSLETEDQVFRKTEAAMEAIARATGSQLDYLDLRTDDVAIILERLKTRPWAHMKQAKLDCRCGGKLKQAGSPFPFRCENCGAEYAEDDLAYE